MAQWAELRAGERQLFCARVGAATAQAAGVIESDMERGLFMGVEEALAYGILDEVSRPDAPVRRLPGSGAGRKRDLLAACPRIGCGARERGP